MTTYRGIRENGWVIVTADGVTLIPRRDLRNHSPTGFEWGYLGSGPAQLALALLAYHFAQRAETEVADLQALSLYQPFKAELIAVLPAAGWTIEGHVIEDTVNLLVAKDARYFFELWSAAEVTNQALQRELTATYERLAELEG